MIVIEEHELEALIQRTIGPLINAAFKHSTEKPLLTTAEVAEMFSVSKYTLIGWRSRRLIPFVKLRGRVLFKRSDLEAFIASRTIRRKDNN
jgi:excisionase family DNA binding protein